MSESHRAKSRNTILVKDDVGKAKPTCFDLPHEHHAYGRCEQLDVEGAREVTMSWMGHVPSKPPPDSFDFVRVNKIATKERIVTPRDMAQFRMSTNRKALSARSPTGPPPKVIPSDVIPSFTYGRKSRPSTPISSVLAARYAAEHEEILGASYERYAAERMDPNSKHKIRVTKTCSLRMNSARDGKSSKPDAAPELFKLNKFKNVPAKIVLTPRAANRSALDELDPVEAPIDEATS